MVGIFIKTCKKDHEWLKWCLMSIEKFTEGFEGVCIVTDTDHKNIIEYENIIKKYPVTITYVPIPIVMQHNCQDKIGYIWMQNIKMLWYRYCKFEQVLQVDSDCIFIRLTTPDYYKTENGKWNWIVRHWEDAEYAIVHKYPLDKLLQKESTHEHMIWVGWIMDRTLTKQFHKWMYTTHKTNWWGYILYRTSEDWGGKKRGSSIYNAYGGYVKQIADDCDIYNFVNPYPKDESGFSPPIKQFWSWAAITDEEKAYRDTVLNDTLS